MRREIKKTKFSSKQAGERLVETGNKENDVFVKTGWERLIEVENEEQKPQVILDYSKMSYRSTKSKLSDYKRLGRPVPTPLFSYQCANIS
ncbi:hypothetical protein [Streptococcus acidominimus]|uniref:Uncharacterized protein n=1 Tax=Streptococcus acidominimus TaxID=1326 RepID=A0A4Y9FSC4_STRAI|nr:hypothetical protein [Streptococcus acidominimus]MBF0818361.1 hypothetical protein [Streptococcus acidominimus]MBF0838127.1 hypothetical protein [Streptococcus acidominimus]MBF0846655.1 hypothetical protein [Streptococcus danieliae]TFU31423.1 hypothetical protein E4U01_02650 [Streptococcus acidominimus]